MNKTSIKITIGVFVGIGLVWGVVTLNNSPDIDTLTEQAETLREEAPKVTAPDFALQSLDGTTITLSEYRGVKPVILDFWASWCHNCRRDMPILNQLSQEYADDIEVIAINLGEPHSTANNFINAQGFTFTTVLDQTGAVSRDYGVTYTNTHVLIDKDGVVQSSFPGDISEIHFESLLTTEENPASS